MKTTVSIYDFREAFKRCNRGDNFSHDGLGVLFDYFEQYEDDCATELELDVIAFCCEYTEASYLEIARMYGLELDEDDSEDEQHEFVLSYLNNNTVVCGVTDTKAIVYADF